MNYRVIRGMFARAWHNPSVRVAFVSSVALILLMAGLTAIGQSRAAGAGTQIRATGTFTTVFPLPTVTSTNSDFPIDPDPITRTSPNNGVNNSSIAERTYGDLFILSRYAVSSFTGSLVGTTVTLQTIVRDDVVEHEAFQMNAGSFFGTLDGLRGSFSNINHVVADRSRCRPGVPCPGSLIPVEGRLTVVEGTGMGELEGICGGGTFKSVLDSTGLPTGVAEYDFTFRFGKDCKANN